jgi:hypothetical protein
MLLKSPSAVIGSSFCSYAAIIEFHEINHISHLNLRIKNHLYMPQIPIEPNLNADLETMERVLLPYTKIIFNNTELKKRKESKADLHDLTMCIHPQECNYIYFTI